MTPRAKGLATLGVVGAIVTAFFAGGVTARQDLDAKYEAKIASFPEKEKVRIIETEIVKRESVPYHPESCALAVEAASNLNEAFGKYNGEVADLERLVQHLSTAILLKSMKDLNKAKQQLFDYDTDTEAVSSALGQAQRMLSQQVNACTTDLDK